jgi:polysaccharide deacetylase 2 family uncharacterized protein YibQ
LDDLNTPLAGRPAKRWPLRLPVTAPQVVAGVFGLFVAVFAGWSVAVDDQLGGEPVVTAALQAPAAGKSAGPAGRQVARSRHDGSTGPGGESEAPPDSKVVTIIDGSSGKRQQVVIPGPAEPDAEKKTEADVDSALLETTRHGRIPKVVAGGRRAVEAYAHPGSVTRANPSGPRIAIVVGGLGISAAGTADALSRLPPQVTLAFAPYGANLDGLAARARARGHEVLLQAPMEPFDYPDNDPGPQTLLTTLSSDQNLDRLHWLMSRFQGYVGITNYMGARFTASEKTLAPVLDDIAKRGLLYLDDGSSARSVASQIAGANSMPFVKAGEVVDAVSTPVEIDRALARLEALARKQGLAVGTATALPVSIDRIVRWAQGVEARGITLVPVTAAASKPKSS